MAESTRAQRAARIRNREGLPEDECVYECGYDSEDCDCSLCDQE